MPRPLVVQDRNPHSYLADFQAELPLYSKTSKLTEFLQKNQDFKSLPESIENLWIQLYERGYIEYEDVLHIQNWIQALLDVGYIFPKTSKVSQVSKVSNTFYNQKALRDSVKIAKPQSQKCETERQVIFGNADLHEGTRSNYASVISHIGQKIALLGLKGKPKNYPAIRDMEGVKVYAKLSPLLQRYNDHSYQLKPAWIFANHKYLLEDKIYKQIEAYVCGFPASMCQLWLPFNNSKIIVMAAHRYNLGRCTEEDWNLWNKQLNILARDNSNTIAAVSRYDAEYLKYYTGIPAKLIPSFSGKEFFNKK